MPTTLRLSLTASCGTTVQVPYTLPYSVRFDCFVPGVGLCNCDVDVSSDVVIISELWPQSGGHGPDGYTHEHYANDAAVFEQAGDVCAVLERALSAESWTSTSQDTKTLTTIADLAVCEQKQRAAVAALGKDMFRTGLPSAMPHEDDHWALSATAMRGFMEMLTGRAQDMATAAAKARQVAWEATQAEHLREARCDARCDARAEVAP